MNWWSMGQSPTLRGVRMDDSFKILQISDLHFGNDFILRSLWNLRWPWNTEDPQIITALHNAIKEVDPAYVIVTGDVVNKCTRRSFRHASAILRTVFANAGIDIKKSVLVIPGNH